MQWEQFVEAARTISWVTYLGTVDASGHPHVAAVAPGFTDGSLWFATRRDSKKYRNLTVNPGAGFHWPVGSGSGPGELACWGTARLHDSDDERRRLWSSGILPYDLESFWKSPDNPALVFVETTISRARLLGPDFVPRVWRR